MMARRAHGYPRTVHQAAQLLGSQIKQGRLERRWPVRELAGRAGISTNTLHKVEQGDPSVLLGTALDLATLVGVPLFHEDRSRLAEEAARSRERVALLPQRVRQRKEDLDNEF
jgi:transcriptional regulator with XRE-family HTH domain